MIDSLECLLSAVTPRHSIYNLMNIIPHYCTLFISKSSVIKRCFVPREYINYLKLQYQYDKCDKLFENIISFSQNLTDKSNVGMKIDCRWFVKFM